MNKKRTKYYVLVDYKSKSISLNNGPFIARPTLIDLNPDEHRQGLSHYSLNPI